MAQDCKSPFLALPAELRNRIYELLVPYDIEAYADALRRPALLQVHPQVKREYTGLFYGSDLLKLDAYYDATDAWCSVSGAQAKLAILQKCTFTDLTDFWSLASARRYCQRVSYNRENVQRGIMTIATNAGFKRWQWSITGDA